ncbi:MAG: hypothetical protein UX87_C0007G0015 [Candidatus Amesbacteria bacterium GW2011_GWA1_47_16]|uniref:Uncharacterized protein n=4 Tax=Candidatus Amesiibacteriota TaxID=1752730 RepID=A0A0G1V2T6_9BACT|nr:MAG: hypothetical protein UX86_C0010G0005 [Candidatus Amesbacteria bacterium GW2011_GWC1_47_15]KKU64507.1 MAG: hypothetical protein UX87_C0007G0015 [Candidatus Amesbacteria bacterium GW2011_GWA1_47_16]KKU97608.1 MAG: hypothetical protein UY28_C0017G0011 [Candidatus Amesbacteria bacterium GW2011_GWB1_48_13]OGD00386.1 MAG: hypothetical protein A2972_03915 [Candidatus Amesbacteria bacterium RIFCSPLOWO2_01_FULL_47_33]OGD00922.1 MAG: hypothetical protein A2701_04850 [Candidatus Amesbacteria bacte
MQHPAVLVSLILLASASAVHAESSSVKVFSEIISNSSTSVTSRTDTNVSISQTGEGTSSVKINGKEYRLDGPGEIKVNESSGTDPTGSPTATTSPTPTPPTTAELTKADQETIVKFMEMIRELISRIREMF